MGFFYRQEERKRTHSDITLIRLFLKRTRSFRKVIFVMTLTIIIQTLLSVISPIFLANVFDELLKPVRNIDVINNNAIIYTLSLIFSWVFGTFIFNQLYGKLVPDFMIKLRLEIFEAIQRQDMKFFDTQKSGQITSKVGSDASEFGNLLFLLPNMLGNTMLILLSLGILWTINAELTLIGLIGIPLILFIILILRKLTRSTSRNYRHAVGEVNAAMAESVSGIQVMKSFGQENETFERFNEVNQKYYKTGYKRALVMGFIYPSLDFVASLSTVIVIWTGSSMLLSSSALSPGQLYIYILYLNRFFFPLLNMATFYSQMQSGFAGFERVLDVIERIPEVKETEKPIHISHNSITGKIDFHDVNFSYIPEKPIFKNFNLTIPAGQTLAIVGHTGAGKTSISSLLMRFYEIQGGSISLDDNDIRDIPLREYRECLGLVTQESFLFAGTIEDNIRYGRQGATDEELWQAIRLAKVDEILLNLKDGLKTFVGERGSRLSEGQRQLVCLARALLANPKILILDEATASVDAYTEAMIQEALTELFKNRTSIVIAHRLSTIMEADRIVVLDQGRIIEEGTHKDLLAKQGQYAYLYKKYYHHQSLEWDPTQKTTIGTSSM